MERVIETSNVPSRVLTSGYFRKRYGLPKASLGSLIRLDRDTSKGPQIVPYCFRDPTNKAAQSIGKGFDSNRSILRVAAEVFTSQRLGTLLPSKVRYDWRLLPFNVSVCIVN